MKGMIFAAGLGSRLRPITDSIPKPLIPIKGRPMIEHVILKMKEAGIDDIVINTHHLAHKIEEFIDRNNAFGIKITIRHEKERLLDTGGGLLNCRDLLDGSELIALYNSDIYSDFSLDSMIEAHSEGGCDVTLLADCRETSRRFLFDSDGMMRGWMKGEGEEVKPVGLDASSLRPLAFGGVHIIEPTVFHALEEYSRCAGKVFSITPFYIDYCRKLKIKAFTPSQAYFWHDIGKPSILSFLENS